MLEELRRARVRHAGERGRGLPVPIGVSASPFGGQVFALFIIAVAAAEAALGLAIIIAVYRLRHTVQVDQIDLMRG